MEEKLRFHLGDQTGSLGGSSWIRPGQTDKHIATEAGERAVDTASLPPASPLECFPGGHLGWATDRMMGGGGGGGRDTPEKMGGGRDGMVPKGGVAGSGPGAGLCADGKRPARRSSKEVQQGG